MPYISSVGNLFPPPYSHVPSNQRQATTPDIPLYPQPSSLAINQAGCFSALSGTPMKTLCSNLDREDGLETVLEVPIPDDILTNRSGTSRAWHNIKSWMKPNAEWRSSSSSSMTEIKLMLGVVGAPLIPFLISSENRPLFGSIKEEHIEASMAKYIVKQYEAAVGGEGGLRAIESMYAVGQVRMGSSEMWEGEGNNKKMVNLKVKNIEMGGFVVWQKGEELWCLEMVISGYKISAGSDGKVAWRQTPWHHSHASRGPPRLLRRFLQGLDPKSTANLFANSVCIGEKTVNNEDCFVLKLEAKPSALGARSTTNVDIIRHTMWGYFSQRTGLLVQLEDSHLVRIKSHPANGAVYWETTMESVIQDYRTIDGINIAHAGKTMVSLFRCGEGPEAHSGTRMEEVWQIEEVDFNVKGLSIDCFLPPSDLKKQEERGEAEGGLAATTAKLPHKIRSASFRINASKIAAINMDDSCISETDEDL